MDYNKSEHMFLELYSTITNIKPLSQKYAVVFVYNEESLIDDEEHASECIPSVEKDMIVNSFRKSIDRKSVV